MATVAMSLGPAPGPGWDDDGYVPVRRVLDRATCAALLARAASGRGAAHDPAADGLGAELVADLVGGPVAVVSSRLDLTLPGSSGTPWSRDGAAGAGTFGLRLAVTAATLATGCPWVVPGSHRHPGAAEPGWPPGGAVPVPLDPGDALVLDGALVHRVTDNHSVDTTAAVIIVFRPAGG